MIKIPTKLGNVSLSEKANPAAPNPKTIEIITNAVAFVLLLVDTPPSKIPPDRIIRPINIVRPVNACIPSMNV